MRILNRIGTALVTLALVVAVSCSSKESDNKSTSSGGGSSSSGGANASNIKIVKASDPDDLKLAFVTNNASEFWKIAAAGVHKYEKEAHVQVDIKMPSNGKVEEQNGIIENLVSQGYNGIAVSAIAPNDQVRNINDAAKHTN